jgi:hypothetical protein
MLMLIQGKNAYYVTYKGVLVYPEKRSYRGISLIYSLLVDYGMFCQVNRLY